MPIGANQLTPKQERFVEEYLVDLNAKQAAIRAGYSEKTAKEQGCRLLTRVHVSEAIQAKRRKTARKMDVSASRVIGEFARIAFADMRDFTSWGPDGVKLIDSAELTDDQAACIAEVSQTTTESGGSLRFKLHDKLSALNSLAKHLGLLPEKHDHQHGGTVHIIQEKRLELIMAIRNQLGPGGVEKLIELAESGRKGTVAPNLPAESGLVPIPVDGSGEAPNEPRSDSGTTRDSNTPGQASAAGD